jgi:BolA protein
MYETEIKSRLQNKFEPTVLEVVNESEKHRGHVNGPKGEEAAETHFYVKICSSQFKGLSRLERHRQVYQVLDDLLPTPIHALRLKLLSLDESQ